MNRSTVLLALSCLLLLVACHKDDWHGHKEYWQIKFDGTFRYKYDANRLLTTLTTQPVRFSPHYKLTYDQLGRPQTAKDSVQPFLYHYRYQGTNLVRIDGEQAGSPATEKYTFSYDHKGRMTRREGPFILFNYFTYEYAGNARNFKRANYHRYSDAKGVAAVDNAPYVYVDYTYDNEHNPYSTLINTTVLPIFDDMYLGAIKFEPMLLNNPTRITYYGNTGSYYEKFMEHRYYYTYKNHYPVKVVDSMHIFNPDGTIKSRSATTRIYEYDKLKK